MKRYGERGGDMKYGQRFRFNNLTQTYAKYKDIFRKRMAKHEEGKIERHFGAAAKAIEAERARAQAAAEKAGTAAPTTAEAKAFRMVCSEPETRSRQGRPALRSFCAGQTTAGEETSKLTKSGFNEFVRKKTKDLQSRRTAATWNMSWKR